MGEPRRPDQATREQLLGVLGEFIAKGGGDRFLLPPVAPGRAAFPEPWAPTTAGIHLLLRRMLWHAGIALKVEIADDRMAKAPPTERKPATRIELLEVRKDAARFALTLIGDDEVAGTLAHEVGTLFAVMNPPESTEPYRTAEPPVREVDADRDLERGSIAAAYLGLGVLAANAAFQQYKSAGRFNGGYVPLEYDVLKAGALPMSALAYLVAVQAVVRGERDAPEGLAPPQRDEVTEWMKALAARRAELCEQLALDTTSRRVRPEVTALDGDDLPPFEPEGASTARRIAFRWQTNRGGLGFVAGTVMGMGFAFVVSRGLMPITTFGGATAGHLIGRRVRKPRCSACATIVTDGATTCGRCGASLRGDIATLADRLEAEERLEEESRSSRHTDTGG